MLKRSVTQTKTWTWGSATSVEQDILKDGYITHIDFSLEITPSATLAGAVQPDGPFRLINNFSIRGGSQMYFQLPAEQGGRLWHYMNRLMYRWLGHGGGVIAGGGPNLTMQPVLFSFHPGSRPIDPYTGLPNYFDLSAFIPGIEESSLTGKWETTANDVMDDTVTLTSAVLKATVYMVQGDPEEIIQEMLAQGVPMDPDTRLVALMTPSPDASVKATTATKSDYNEEFDIVTGGYLRGIGILAQDATATRPLRAADIVTEIAIKMPGIGTRLIEMDCEPLWCSQPPGSYLIANDGAVGGMISVAEGVFYLPLANRGIGPISKIYGLDMSQARTGDWKLGLTIYTYASGDDVLIFYDRLIPYTGMALRDAARRLLR